MAKLALVALKRFDIALRRYALVKLKFEGGMIYRRIAWGDLQDLTQQGCEILFKKSSDLCGHFIEFLTVKILVIFPYTPNRMQQFSHDGGNGLQWLFSGHDELVIKSVDIGLPANGYQRRHIQGRS